MRIFKRRERGVGHFDVLERTQIENLVQTMIGSSNFTYIYLESDPLNHKTVKLSWKGFNRFNEL